MSSKAICSLKAAKPGAIKQWVVYLYDGAEVGRFPTCRHFLLELRKRFNCTVRLDRTVDGEYTWTGGISQRGELFETPDLS